MSQNKRPSSALQEAWQRLEAVCRKLWDENSTSAVEVQAVVEEFKGEVHRVDAYFANVEEQREHERRENEEDLAALRRQYESDLSVFKKRLDAQEAVLREKEARIEELLKTIARKEEENLEFHSQILRMTATSDESKAKKMEEFYQELLKKEASLQGVWDQRHKALEDEHSSVQRMIAAKQAELDAWERRRLSDEDALKKKTTDLEIKSQQLAQEYRKKQQEIEDLKAGLQRSITDLVRQYQSRLRGPDGSRHGPEPTPAPGSH
jgi:hypothetical protein